MPIPISLGSSRSFLSGSSRKLLQNYSSGSLTKFRTALAAMVAGSSFPKVLVIGDSTTAGAISDAAEANYRPNSYVQQLASLLTYQGFTSCMTNALGNAKGSQGANQGIGIWDGRLTGTGSFALNPNDNHGVGGLLLGTASAAAGTLTFTPGVSTDTCDVYYYDQTAVFEINIDGEAALATVTGGGTNTCKKQTVTYAAGVHAINVVWVSGGINIGGFDAYTAATKQIHLLNCGQGSAKASTLASNSPNFAPGRWYAFIAPSLSIISLGINDWINSTAVATYSSSLQTIITNCLTSGDVILMTPFPSATSQAALATQATYVDAMRTLAYTNNIPFIDENANLGSKVAMTGNGYGSDENHPNYAGMTKIATDINAALASVL